MFTHSDHIKCCQCGNILPESAYDIKRIVAYLIGGSITLVYEKDFFCCQRRFQQLILNFKLILNLCLYFLLHVRFQSIKLIHTMNIYITNKNDVNSSHQSFRTRTQLRCSVEVGNASLLLMRATIRTHLVAKLSRNSRLLDWTLYKKGCTFR